MLKLREIGATLELLLNDVPVVNVAECALREALVLAFTLALHMVNVYFPLSDTLFSAAQLTVT